MEVFCAYTQQKKMLMGLLLEYAEKQKSAFEDIFQSANTRLRQYADNPRKEKEDDS